MNPRATEYENSDNNLNIMAELELHATKITICDYCRYPRHATTNLH